MLISSVEKSSSSVVIAYKIGNTSDLAHHFQVCSRMEISGRLDLSVANDPKLMWSFYLHLGQLIWSVGGLHPIRRWHRQLSQYCPQLTVSSLPQTTICPCDWSYESLAELVKQRQIQQSSLSEMILGNTLELLFDVIQVRHQSQPSLEMHLTYHPLSSTLMDSIVLTALKAERVGNEQSKPGQFGNNGVWRAFLQIWRP